MASGIITNNVRVAIACFAGGIFLGVGSLVLLGFNGLVIGATAGHFANAGLLGYMLEFIVGHGLLELFAIWIAGAAGFLLGRSVLVPGPIRPQRCPGAERADGGPDGRRCRRDAAGGGDDRRIRLGGDGRLALRIGASAASIVFLFALSGQREPSG